MKEYCYPPQTCSRQLYFTLEKKFQYKTTSPPERKKSIDNLFHPQTKSQKEKDLTKITQEACVSTPLTVNLILL